MEEQVMKIMRIAAASFLAGIAVAWGTIIAAGGAGMFLGGAVVATIAFIAALVAIGPGRVARFLAVLGNALEAAQAPSDEFTELRAEVVAELVKAGVDYDDADAAVSQTARTGPADRRAWLRRSRALLKEA
jgi:hypothetical protein